MTTDKKKQNNQLIQAIINELIQIDDIIPVGQLSVFFHSVHGLSQPWGSSNDLHERRNFEYFKFLNPNLEYSLLQATISGILKPQQFIHPLDKYYYTNAGYYDTSVLPEYYKMVDKLAGSFKQQNHTSLDKYRFLASVYLYFLIIHPFIDGNGRVSRNLLDYYNKKIGLYIKPVWNNENPKFSKSRLHKKALQTFFQKEAKISKYKFNDMYDYLEVSSLLIIRKDDLIKLSGYLISELRRIGTVNQPPSESITIMMSLLKKLQDKKE